jgi:hypothetical protein
MARSRDKAGNVSPWTSSRCTARPLDDRAVTASAGWSRVTGSGYYAGTVTKTTQAGRTLTRTGAITSRVALVATTCATCGRVQVLVNGGLYRTVSLYSATTKRQVLIVLPPFSVRAATVTLKTLDNRLVEIDGLGLSRT